MPPKEKQTDQKLRGDEEKKTPDQKKRQESEKGRQYVANVDKAREARTGVNEHTQHEQEASSGLRRSSRNTAKKIVDADHGKRPLTKSRRKRAGDNKGSGGDGNGEEQRSEADGKAPKKKKAKTGQNSNTIGSKHDPAVAPAQQGSNSRLPEKGQQAHWKAMPGWIDGKVLEIITSTKEVNGKQVKASKDEPRVVLKSSAKSGKICVHKPDNVYFD